jgi:hypothetical protein
MMSLPLKYKVGDSLGDFKITDIDCQSPIKYFLECKNGHKRLISSSKMSKLNDCKQCKIKIKKESLIRNKINNFLITNVGRKGKRKIYHVKCKCGNEVIKSLSQIKNTTGCRKCAKGYYPGLVKNGITFIKKISRYEWEMKCYCGIFFSGNSLKIRKGCGCSKLNYYFENCKKKIGYRFGSLKVIDVEKGNRHNILVCKCKCGNIKKVVNGHEKKQISCGCLKIKNMVNSENHVRSKFTNVEIKAMRELFETKQYNIEDLAYMYKLSKWYIKRILNRSIWKHV